MARNHVLMYCHEAKQPVPRSLLPRQTYRLLPTSNLLLPTDHDVIHSRAFRLVFSCTRSRHSHEWGPGAVVLGHDLFKTTVSPRSQETEYPSWLADLDGGHRVDIIRREDLPAQEVGYTCWVLYSCWGDQKVKTAENNGNRGRSTLEIAGMACHVPSSHTPNHRQGMQGPVGYLSQDFESVCGHRSLQGGPCWSTLSTLP